MSTAQETNGSDYLSELIKSVMGTTPAEQSESSTAATATNAESSRPTSDIFSSLLSNPELLAKLPAILSTVRPIIDALGKSSGQTAPVSAPNTTASVSQSPQENKSEPHNDRRAALLCAMKPYLGHDRQMAIDYIIKLSRLGEILKTL